MRRASIKAGSASATTNFGAAALAGGNLSIRASEGNIEAIGATLGGQNVALEATRDIKLLAAIDSTSERSSNSSSSSSIGVAYSMGGSANGFSLQFSASRGQGSANGDSTTWQNTVVAARDTLTIKSGADTTLIGAQASGRRITADIGGNLAIQSLQDIANYHATQSSSGVGISLCVPPLCTGMSSASLSTSQSKTDSNYASVNQQSGLFAGDGGFDIKVKSNTDLKGGVMPSEASAERNSLSTGTLTMSDLQNRTSTTASSGGMALGTVMLQGGYQATKGVVGNLMNSGKAGEQDASITRSAIAAGTLTITDDAGQKQLTGLSAAQTVAAANRDSTDTNRVLAKPDIAAVQKAAQDQQTYKMLVFETVTTFTDKKVVANQNAKNLLQVCKEEPCARDPLLGIDPNRKDKDGNPNIVNIEIKPDQLATLGSTLGPGLVVFTDGILSNAQNTAETAVQNAAVNKPDVVEETGRTKPYTLSVHVPTTGSIISDALGTGYDLLLGPTLGYAAPDRMVADAVKETGSTTLLAHSGGTARERNALNILGEQGYKSDTLAIQAKEPVVSPAELMTAASQVNKKIDPNNPQSEATTTYFQYSAHPNDFVSTLFGRNPQGNVLGSLKEAFSVLFSSTSVHVCGGTGAAGCKPADSIDPPYSYGPTKEAAQARVDQLNATSAQRGGVARLLQLGPVYKEGPLPIDRAQEQLNQLTLQVGTATLPTPLPVFWLTLPPAPAPADPRINAASQLLLQLKPGGQ